MATVNLLPGYGFVVNTGTGTNLLPGYGFVSGTFSAGGANIKTVDGLALASVKTFNGLAVASVKTKLGVTAQ